MEFINWFAQNKDGIISLSVLLAAFTSLGGVVWVARITTRAARNDQINRLREVWINELRNDVSNLIAHHSEDPKLIDNVNSRNNLLVARIQMRLTSKKKTHENLFNAVSDFAIEAGKADGTKEWHNRMTNVARNLIANAQVVLKEAWDQIAK